MKKEDIGQIPREYKINGVEQFMPFSQVDVAVMQWCVDGKNELEIFSLLGHFTPKNMPIKTKNNLAEIVFDIKRQSISKARGMNKLNFDGFRRALIFAAKWGIVDLDSLPSEIDDSQIGDGKQLFDLLGIGLEDKEIIKRLQIDKDIMAQSKTNLQNTLGLNNEHQIVVVSARSLGYLGFPPDK